MTSPGLAPDITPRDGAIARKAAILLAATTAFGEHGYKASSLRDIAAHAGVSLTLLDHHFGAKARLLEAVVEAHHVACRRALEPLRALLAASASALRLEAFVSAWIHCEYASYDGPATVHSLRLLTRLQADPDVDAAMRARLHCAKPLFLQALRRICPSPVEERLEGAWLLARSAAHAAILRARELADDGLAATSHAAPATESFVFAGLLAYLNLEA